VDHTQLTATKEEYKRSMPEELYVSQDDGNVPFVWFYKHEQQNVKSNQIFVNSSGYGISMGNVCCLSWTKRIKNTAEKFIRLQEH
jgi:hypothetical protein